ncbi:unnamed protein product [Penicillium discolor]
MSNLQYFNYDGWGQKAKQNFYYTRAVRIGDRIEYAGQGIYTSHEASPSERIDRVDNIVFANVDLNLKHGGRKGWEQVFQLNSYHVPINNEALGADGVEF